MMIIIAVPFMITQEKLIIYCLIKKKIKKKKLIFLYLHMNFILINMILMELNTERD